jgi:capsular polysaccharide biosynthesis protein
MTTKALLPAERCSRRPPENLLFAERGLFEHEYAKDFGAVFGTIVAGVQVLPNGILTGSFSLLSETWAIPPRGLRKMKVAARAIQGRVFSSRVTNVARGLFVTDEFSNGFFHWICDVLPRLEALSQAGREELAAMTLIVPAMAYFPYVLPSLQPFTMQMPRILQWHERVFCEELLIIPPVAPTGNYRPSLMRLLRMRFRRHFAVTSRSKRVYISRRDSAKRNIANEAEILPVLVRHGFECIIAEELPFAEQVRLLGSASHVVSNHGAGLTNILWMSPGSRVLELRRSGDGENNCYFSLASALELSYYYLQCAGTNPGESSHSGNVTADPKALEKVLRAFTTETAFSG